MARRKNDAYDTPAWCVRRLLEDESFHHQWMEAPAGPVLEPCAGNGNIIETVNEFDKDVASGGWVATELRPECRGSLLYLCDGGEKDTSPNVLIGDFFSPETRAFVNNWRPSCVITNPPYSLAVPFITACLDIVGPDGVVAMLLRLNFMSSSRRAGFFKGNMPDIYVLPDRPNFVLSDKGSTSDMQEYAWFVWSGVRTDVGAIRRLGVTHRSERPKPTK